MYEVIHNSITNHRIIDETGAGIATFYHKDDAREYVEFLNNRDGKLSKFKTTKTLQEIINEN